jgi:hypothetical protein
MLTSSSLSSHAKFPHTHTELVITIFDHLVSKFEHHLVSKFEHHLVSKFESPLDIQTSSTHTHICIHTHIIHTYTRTIFTQHTLYLVITLHHCPSISPLDLQTSFMHTHTHACIHTDTDTKHTYTRKHTIFTSLSLSSSLPKYV